MLDSRDFRRFLSWMIASILVGAILVVAVIVLVDPYRLYQLIDAPGFNQVKPAPDRYQTEIKLTLARRVKANVLVLGNSRAEIGLNPRSLADPASGDTPYNLAISGTGIAVARNELAYLHSVGQTPAKVILGLDFLDFLVSPVMLPTPAHSPPAGYAVDRLHWKFDALFSLTSFTDALTTLRIQDGVEVPTITSEGFDPLLEYNKYAREEGYFAIFRQRAIEYARIFIRKPHTLMISATGTSPELDDLRAILAIAAQDNIELQMLVYPYHAHMLAMFEQTGLWPAFEQWKGLLTREVATAKQKNPEARIALWDFSGFSAIQCEPIPLKNDKQAITRWYWESGHFKQSVGDLMLARLRETKQGVSLQSDKLGFRLVSSNLLENQARMARERSDCLAATPQIFDDASHLVLNARKELR